MSIEAVVLMPTYNEVDNIERMAHDVRATGAALLIIDDNSPDGTGKIADRLAAADPQMHVLHRPSKQGLGPAYVAGFEWALEHGAKVLVEMDADGSHSPSQLPALIAAVDHADIAQGSRWVRGGEVANWPWYRLAISRAGSWYSRMMLGLKVRDMTGGFRAYRADALRRIRFDSVQSAGYCFQIDMLRRASAAGLRIVEVPITFVDRVEGTSKMSTGIVVEAMWKTTIWGFQRMLGKPISAPSQG